VNDEKIFFYYRESHSDIYGMIKGAISDGNNPELLNEINLKLNNYDEL
jgi:hypothetical protein